MKADRNAPIVQTKEQVIDAVETATCQTCSSRNRTHAQSVVGMKNVTPENFVMQEGFLKKSRNKNSRVKL